MDDPEPRVPLPEQAPRILELRPIATAGGEPWTVRLEPEILTLLDPKGQSVLKVHQEEAARYMRFGRHIVRGRTVAFAVVQGRKRYSFRCTKHDVDQFLSWLPRQTPARLAQEMRHSGIGVTLFGVLHLLLAPTLFVGWGIGLVAAGLATIALERPAMYLLNGLLMIAVGFWDLIPWARAEEGFASVIVGSALVIFGARQISMLGANERLRAARTIRDQHAALLPGESRIVQRIGLLNLWAAVVFGVYTVAVLASSPIRATGIPAAGGFGRLGPVLADLVVFGVLTLLTGASAALFLARKHPAYAEVKVSAQMLITVLVFSFWGTVFSFGFGGRRFFCGGIFSSGLTLLVRPYVWGSLLVCVLAFNRWFTRAVDRELEEQRG